MAPPVFPDPELLVTLTGVAEIAGTLGLPIPRVAPATGLALLRVAVFPANADAARQASAIGGSPALPLALRFNPPDHLPGSGAGGRPRISLAGYLSILNRAVRLLGTTPDLNRRQDMSATTDRTEKAGSAYSRASTSAN
jgi:hypothetical protein